MYKLFITIFVALLVVSTNSTGIYSNDGVYSGDEKLNDPKNKDCVEKCPVRAILSPVCGSDGKTYTNIDSLNCLDECLKPLGQSVKKESNGFCINDLPPHLRPSTAAPSSA